MPISCTITDTLLLENQRGREHQAVISDHVASIYLTPELWSLADHMVNGLGATIGSVKGKSEILSGYLNSMVFVMKTRNEIIARRL